MAAEDLLESAANDIADGRPVDWGELAPRAQTDADRQRLECLRIVAAIADLHRSHDAILHSATATGPGPLRTGDAQTDGEAWGRYRLLEQVGAGSFGSVYRAWDPELEREIAIKILHPHVTDDTLRERLLHEGRALAKIRHPNVISVFGVESHGDRVGLCMEFIHGETLEARLRAFGTWGAREALLVGQDVCRALAAVHQAGFVHRDVKSRNIMRERGTGRTVLMDFGTGRQIAHDSPSMRAGIAGTPMYMAPEVLAGQPASACSDVYGVGVLLYHLVTGQYPVEGTTLDDLRTAHMLGRRTPMAEHAPDLPLRFIQVVEQALSPNPQQRCPSAGAMLEALAAADETAAPAKWAHYLGIAALAAAGALAVLTMLGGINSRYFNVMLARSEYANEGVIDWLYWGLASSVAPVVLFIGALLIVALLSAARRFAVSTWSIASRAETAIIARARQLHLDEPTTQASVALVLSTLVLLVTWWYYSPLVGSLLNDAFPNVSTAAPENLAFLSPEFTPYHQTYRASFIWVTIASGFLWYPVLMGAARRGEPLNRGILAGGVAVMVLSVLLLDFPYRLLVHSEFEPARWRGENCYIIGERGADLLLFCPELPPPRNRVVSRSSTELERTGGKQNIFASLQKQH